MKSLSNKFMPLPKPSGKTIQFFKYIPGSPFMSDEQLIQRLERTGCPTCGSPDPSYSHEECADGFHGA